MTVLLRLSTGKTQFLDRNLRTDQVAQTINEGRGKGQLVPFQNNDTPKRTIYIDPDQVIAIVNNGFPY